MSEGPITFADPDAVVRFTPGMTIVFVAPWWKRLWAWFKFRVLRRPRPTLTITRVDHFEGTVTAESGPCERP